MLSFIRPKNFLLLWRSLRALGPCLGGRPFLFRGLGLGRFRGLVILPDGSNRANYRSKRRQQTDNMYNDGNVRWSTGFHVLASFEPGSTPESSPEHWHLVLTSKTAK